MKKMTNDEYKERLLTMFSYFNEFCKKNNIEYSLIGGSLIGAIRHNGMIPWDDDIDVVMSLSNYKKLQNIMENDCNNNDYYFCNHINNSSYFYPYIKLIDKKTIIKNENNYKTIDNYGIFIDIFCYNYLPDNKILQKLYFVKLLILKSIISGYANSSIKKGDKYKYIKIFGKFFAKILGIKRILQLYNNLTLKERKKSKNLISNWPSYALSKEIQDSNIINEYINHNFDGINASIFKKYDLILKRTYGDYMILPPKEERKTHNIETYWRQ